jgi:hypothetical protein
VRLPNADRAVVAPGKVRDYRLSLEHPVARPKVRFFLALGFTRADWPALQRALLVHARGGDAAPGAPSAFGQTYQVEGNLQGPLRAAMVHTIWLVRIGNDRPELITAFPG